MIQRIRKGWRTLRENKRAGVSLIVALCAVALIIGLALSLTYSSSLLLARANRKGRGVSGAISWRSPFPRCWTAS